ncbi:hypothetical protein CI610_00323 [invertebrate metagenome]|uniref:Holliday junction resolvase n=1 Tax=invertebrate metagenome TaxID=1711999 RepID=A0A2H9TBP2_9ZZZZ
MGSQERDKGGRGEREFATVIRELTSGEINLTRNLEQVRNGGADLDGHDAFAFEIKRRRDPPTDATLTGWWMQTVDQALVQNKKPVLAYRQDRQSWRVVVHMEHGFRLEDPRGCLTMDVEMFCRFMKEFSRAEA